MTRNGLTWRGATRAAGLAAVALLASATAAAALDVYDTTVDRRVPAEGTVAAKTRTVLGMKTDDFKKLAAKGKVFVDIKVLLDGKTKYAVMSSEEQDERRYNVDCRAGAYGRLPMNEGTEYYIRSDDEEGKRVDLSVFPGSRSVNPDNDVSCVADSAHPNAAILRIRGLYRVLTNDFGDRLVVELRPLTRETLTADEQKKLP